MTSRVHACLDCGTPTAAKGEFCSTACRTAFNNRRRQRGAEFYDLYMAHRFERGLAAQLGLFQAINRLASMFRQDDKDRRAGRKSWRSPRLVMDERPYLKSIVTHETFGRRGSA